MQTDYEYLPQDFNFPGDDLDPNKKGSQEENDEEDYDILPSNGPGLTGDDGEQVIDEGESDDEDEDDEDDDE